MEEYGLLERGVPEHLRSDNGPEFTARAVRLWLQGVGATTLFITPGSPWENGYVESFNGKLRDELLDRELFDTLWEVQVLTPWAGTGTVVPEPMTTMRKRVRCQLR